MTERAKATPPAGESIAALNDHLGRMLQHADRLLAEWQEHADAMWVVSVHDSEAESRYAEAALAARYGLPTLPFVARAGVRSGPGSLVGNQELIDRLFEELDTDKGGRLLFTVSAAGRPRV